MGIYAWVAAAKSIKAKVVRLTNSGYELPATSGTDIEAAVLVATIYATVRLTTASHTSAAAMVASNVAWRVASTIGCSEHYINMLIEQCASAYRVAEQDLPAYKAAAIEQRIPTIPATEQPQALTHIERYIQSAIPATSEARVARALYMLSIMAAKQNMSLAAYIELLTSSEPSSSL